MFEINSDIYYHRNENNRVWYCFPLDKWNPDTIIPTTGIPVALLPMLSRFRFTNKNPQTLCTRKHSSRPHRNVDEQWISSHVGRLWTEWHTPLETLIPLRSVNIKLMPTAYSSNQIRSAYVKDLDIHHFHDVCGFQKMVVTTQEGRTLEYQYLYPSIYKKKTCPVLL